MPHPAPNRYPSKTKYTDMKTITLPGWFLTNLHSKNLRPALIPCLALAAIGSAGAQTTGTANPTPFVGIGTTTPGQKLDVAGRVKILTMPLSTPQSDLEIRSDLAGNLTSNFPSVEVLQTARQTVSTNNVTVDLVNYAKVRDPQNAFDATTGVFTAPVAGTYEVSWSTNSVLPAGADSFYLRTVLVDPSVPAGNAPCGGAYFFSNTGGASVNLTITTSATGFITLAQGGTTRLQYFTFGNTPATEINNIKVNRLSFRLVSR